MSIERGQSCKNRPGGTREKPLKTTSSIQKEYGHRLLSPGATYSAAKIIRWVSLAIDRSLGAKRLLPWQAQAAQRWSAKTIFGPKEPASKTL